MQTLTDINGRTTNADETQDQFDNSAIKKEEGAETPKAKPVQLGESTREKDTDNKLARYARKHKYYIKRPILHNEKAKYYTSRLKPDCASTGPLVNCHDVGIHTTHCGKYIMGKTISAEDARKAIEAKQEGVLEDKIKREQAGTRIIGEDEEGAEEAKKGLVEEGAKSVNTEEAEV